MPDAADTNNEQWTLPAPEVVTPHPISIRWLPVIGLLSPWVPKRLGPHLVGLPWWYVLTSGVWLALLTGMIYQRMEAPLLWWPLQLTVDFGGVRMIVDSGGVARPHYVVWMKQGLVDAGLLLLALLCLSPLFWAVIAVGERRRTLAGRAAKVLLWSGGAVFWIVLLHRPLWQLLQVHGQAAYWLLVLIYVTWWLSVVARLGSRYSGPRLGPRWEPFEPVCEPCRYTLVGLARDARCPECGRLVSESAPDFRQPPDFALAEGWARGPAYLRTLGAVLRQSDFCGRLAIWKRRRSGDRFFYWTCALGGLVAALLLLLRGLSLSPSWESNDLAWMPQQLSWLLFPTWTNRVVWQPLLGGLSVGLALLLLGWGERISQSLLFGGRKALHNAMLLNYMMGWLLVILLVGGVALLVADLVVRQWHHWSSYHVWGLLVHSDVLVYLLGLIPGVGLTVLGLLHGGRQIKLARHGNG